MRRTPLRSLGRSDLTVSRLGLGLAALGRPGYMTLGHGRDLGIDRGVEAMERHAHAVLDAAWGAGVRYLDAARSYGRAEDFLRSWLHTRGITPAQVTVGSKWGYVYIAGWRTDAPVHEVLDPSVENLRRQLEESRERLGAHLRLYQIHSASLDTGVLEDPRVLAELARARTDGLLIGLSTTGPSQADTLRRALEVRVDGEPLFGSVQATWNLLEPSAGPALAEAHAAGWGVIIKEALANGRLTHRGEDSPASRELRAIAEGASVNEDAVALALALRQPWADTVLSGAATPLQVRSNARALALVDAELPWERLGAHAEPPGVYWARRKQLPWT